MTRKTFVECFHRLQQAPDAVQTELFPKTPPEPFFTATIGGQEISFYTYTGDTGNYDASRVVEALRDETAQKSIAHDNEKEAIACNFYQLRKQLKIHKGQQSLFDDTHYINVPSPPEIPYKKYILFSPRDMFEFMNQNNPNRELTNP
jgi:hypothetical protein